jgi:hypothetical protein
MKDGSVAPPMDFTFVQADGTNFTYSNDSYYGAPSGWFTRIEYSWNGSDWHLYWTFNNNSWWPATEPNYEPFDETFTPVPFVVSNTYYMRARYQDHATTPTETTAWVTKSFVAV